jgi:3',5'-cyclic AMP phosphodiesterase CpdA
MKRLAHLSDLHLGLDAATDRATIALRDSLLAAGVEHIVVTGDITHRGRRTELERYYDIFGDLIAEGRVSAVPGNHDRLNDDVGDAVIDGPRVQAEHRDGLSVIRVDSTGEHNSSLFLPHGELDEFDLAAVDRALNAIPKRHLRVLILHHHPLPLPTDSFAETVGGFLKWTRTDELASGDRLLRLLRGRCDLVLHGHRHLPNHVRPFPNDAWPIDLYNAGSSTELGSYRVFAHDRGFLINVTTAVSNAASAKCVATATAPSHGWRGSEPMPMRIAAMARPAG